METLLASVITGCITLIGVLIANGKTQAVLETRVEELTRDFGMSESGVKMTLLRLRRELKEQLKQEGIEP